MRLSLSREPQNRSRHLAWLISVLLFISFALTDAAVVGWYASVLTGSEIFAGGFTFWLISVGLIVTVWKLDR